MTHHSRDHRQIVTLMITDGRKDCFIRMLESFWKRVQGWDEITVVNDSADGDYGEWLERQVPEASMIHNRPRQGFAGAIQAGWNAVLPKAEWIFHVEDDFVFLRDIDLIEMKKVLVRNGNLAQMALMRQPVVAAEIEAGGLVEQWPGEYMDCSEAGIDYLVHRLFFTTNPSLYHRIITVKGWPQQSRSEQSFTDRLLLQGLSFGYWGKRTDGPWVEHVGALRVGKGY